MKQAFSIFLMMASVQAFACSMQVDQNYTKNFLITHAASSKSLSLMNVSGISVINYDHTFSGGTGGGSCPDYISVSGRVSMKYGSPAKVCTYTVTVLEKTYIGNDQPSGQIQTVQFSNPITTCRRGVLL